MKENKITAWVKAHKKKIAIATGTAVCGVIAYVIARKAASTDLPIPEMVIGKITELWEEAENNEEVVRMIAEGLTVADMGQFGEELVKNIDGITPESNVSVIMGVTKE